MAFGTVKKSIFFPGTNEIHHDVILYGEKNNDDCREKTPLTSVNV
jgi:hypothetical protein